MANADDFNFVLQPNTRYWFVVNGAVWNAYRTELKSVFGKDSFRTVQATEKAVEVDESFWDAKAPIRKVVATWVLLAIGENPIEVSATIMGTPHVAQPGDSPTSTGAFEQPDPHWIVDASEAVEAIRFWAEEVSQKASDFGDVVAKKAGELYDDVTEAPERLMQKIEKQAEKLAWLLVAAGLGALAIWKVTTR